MAKLRYRRLAMCRVGVSALMLLAVLGIGRLSRAAQPSGAPTDSPVSVSAPSSEQGLDGHGEQPRVRGDAPVQPGSAAAIAQARQYFLGALEYYRTGDYAGALRALHWAVYLDPGSKDLEYNLAVVYEKQGQLGAAIEHWRRYGKLERNRAERERAQLAVQRLMSVVNRQRDGNRTGNEGIGSDGSAGAPEQTQEPEARRAFQDWAIGAGVVAATALCVGAVLGVRALLTDPDSGRPGEGETMADLEARARRAHTYAVGADVAFSVSVGAGVAAGMFWFAEPASASNDNRRLKGSLARKLGVTLGGVF